MPLIDDVAKLGWKRQHGYMLSKVVRVDEDVLNASEHKHGEGIIDHGFVINRQKLFADNSCDRIKPCAGSTGKYNSLKCHLFYLLSFKRSHHGDTPVK